MNKQTIAENLILENTQDFLFIIYNEYNKLKKNIEEFNEHDVKKIFDVNLIGNFNEEEINYIYFNINKIIFSQMENFLTDPSVILSYNEKLIKEKKYQEKLCNIIQNKIINLIKKNENNITDRINYLNLITYKIKSNINLINAKKESKKIHEKLKILKFENDYIKNLDNKNITLMDGIILLYLYKEENINKNKIINILNYKDNLKKIPINILLTEILKLESLNGYDEKIKDLLDKAMISQSKIELQSKYNEIKKKFFNLENKKQELIEIENVKSLVFKMQYDSLANIIKNQNQNQKIKNMKLLENFLDIFIKNLENNYNIYVNNNYGQNYYSKLIIIYDENEDKIKKEINYINLNKEYIMKTIENNNNNNKNIFLNDLLKSIYLKEQLNESIIVNTKENKKIKL